MIKRCKYALTALDEIVSIVGSPTAEEIKTRVDIVRAALSHVEGEARPVMKYTNSPAGYQVEWECLDYGTHLLYAHPAPQAAVPDGFKPVPEFPDSAMVQAGGEAIQCRQGLGIYHQACATYRAMVMCAPTEPTEEPTWFGFDPGASILRELSIYREALARIGQYPKKPALELGYAQCRQIAREALVEAKKWRAAIEGGSNG